MRECTADAELRRLISSWIAVAEGTPAPEADRFFRFAAAWIAFNAMYSDITDVSLELCDSAMVDRFCRRQNVWQAHKRLHRSVQPYAAATAIITEKAVFDVRRVGLEEDDFVAARREDEAEYFDTVGSSRDFRRMMRVIYRIRCNLFHGGKRLYNPRDVELIDASQEVVLGLVRELNDRDTSDLA